MEEKIIEDTPRWYIATSPWGGKLTLRGGINAVLWNDTDKIIAEIDHKIPILKENGGFIFSSDHSIPNSVSLENMKRIVEEVKRVGRY